MEPCAAIQTSVSVVVIVTHLIEWESSDSGFIPTDQLLELGVMVKIFTSTEVLVLFV